MCVWKIQDTLSNFFVVILIKKKKKKISPYKTGGTHTLKDIGEKELNKAKPQEELN